MAMAVRRERHDSEKRRGLHRPALRGDRLASRASHVRARVVFMLLDVIAVAAAYGASEVAYFRDAAPADLLAALQPVPGPRPGRPPRRQLGLRPLRAHLALRRHRRGAPGPAVGLVRPGRLGVAAPALALPSVGLERVPLRVVFVGCAFVTMAMGALRFSSRLFAWQRGTNRVGLRVAVIGSRDAGAEAIREMLRTPVAGFVPVAVFDDDGHSPRAVVDRRAGGGRHRGHPRRRGPLHDPTGPAGHLRTPRPRLVERALRASEAAGVTMKILPSARDMAAGKEHTAADPPGPRAAHRGPPGTDDGQHRPQHGATLHHRPACPHHRGRRVDRLGDRPAGGRVQPGAAAAARPRRDPPARHRGRPPRPMRAAAGRRGRPGRGVRGLPRRTGPTWCSTPPPTSTCRSSSPTPWRPSASTCTGPRTSSRPRPRPGPGASC